MFDPSETPRLFGLPPGADFPVELVAGLRNRLAGTAPEAMANVRIYVNTRRMERRLTEIWSQGPACLLPRIMLVSDVVHDPALGVSAAPTSPLRRRLDLARLIDALITEDPSLAPRSAIFDLADSLAALLDEMQGENVDISALSHLDVQDESGHWARSLRFLEITGQYLAGSASSDPEARQRQAVEALVTRWQTNPPSYPVLVAGSTGSRGTTALFMRAVAKLPQGALILPGFDFELPPDVWSNLSNPMEAEDHPQYRFASLVRDLGVAPTSVARWTRDDPARQRNRLISLALRPAPVTDQWMVEGPDLPDLRDVTQNMELIEAPSPRLEAAAIAFRLREAVYSGQRAALITPDRTLARQVTAALDRWRIEPDDSAGRPLALSAPGRLLRHVVTLMGVPLTAEALLIVLKHPLVHTGSAGRADHLRFTRDLELWLRRRGPAFLNKSVLVDWAEDRADPAVSAWIGWICDAILQLGDPSPKTLGALVAFHISATEKLSAGSDQDGSGTLWDASAGEAAHRAIADLRAQADTNDLLELKDYSAIIDMVLAAEPVRDPVRSNPDVVIWGTLEARVQGADLVVLGGLSDGVWPEKPPQDPWLNRRMRRDIGLLLPERRVGLAAHDFQQAIAAPEIVLTRSLRNTDAETVMSRWLNRLTNLMSGLPDRNGPAALEQMRDRGRVWLSLARLADDPIAKIPPASRPAPSPPPAARPDVISITRVQTLIRDPYAIYARQILGLRRLDPLRQSPDAPLRGTVLHDIFEAFIVSDIDPSSEDAGPRFLALADRHLADSVPWPAARHIWRAKLARIVPWFLQGEIARRVEGRTLVVEERGRYTVTGTDMTLVGQADRIDLLHDDSLVIYDYKSGTPPSPKQVKTFDLQLLIEAVMAEDGAFGPALERSVAAVAYIGLGVNPTVQTIPLRDPTAKLTFDPDEIKDGLARLFGAFAERRKGYASRRAMSTSRWPGDYDHLARFGEWTDADTPVTEIIE